MQNTACNWSIYYFKSPFLAPEAFVPIVSKASVSLVKAGMSGTKEKEKNRKGYHANIRKRN